MVAPGNPGIAELADCRPIAASDTASLVALARLERVDLVVVGPESPLAAGMVDALHEVGIRAFGPTRKAAMIESSKRFAKQLMLDAGIPTARASWHTDAAAAKAAARGLGFPVVIKASGLAAGKGVSICGSMEEADSAIDAMLQTRVFGDAGDEILVEEFMVGEELSVFALSDGVRFVLMLPAQDHKRLLAGDGGPNTGGMGAYAPVSIATAVVLQRVSEEIIAPTLRSLREHGAPFQGLLYGGLMLTAEGPQVVEFNCRFGDPETQAVLPLMRSSLLDLMLRCSESGGLDGAPEPRFSPESAVTTVLAAPGYPEAARTGAPITVSELEEGTLLFQAGTKRAPDGGLVTAGGRVVAVTGLGHTLEEARAKSLRGVERVHFPGRQFRGDIGWREMKRHAGAT